MDELPAWLAIVIASVSVYISWGARGRAVIAEKRVVATKEREERRYKIGVLVRCVNPETERDALNEVFSAFYDSPAVRTALQRFHVGLEVREETQPAFPRRGADILGIIKQKRIDALKEKLVEAMCEDVGIGYGLFSAATGFTEEQLARYKYKSKAKL